MKQKVKYNGIEIVAELYDSAWCHIRFYVEIKTKWGRTKKEVLFSTAWIDSPFVWTIKTRGKFQACIPRALKAMETYLRDDAAAREKVVMTIENKNSCWA